MIHHSDWLAEIYGQSFSIYDDLNEVPEFAWRWIGLYSVADPNDPEVISVIKETNKEYELVENDALPSNDLFSGVDT